MCGGGECVSGESTGLHVSRCVCARVSLEDVCRVIISHRTARGELGARKSPASRPSPVWPASLLGGRWKGRGEGEFTLNLESCGHCLLLSRDVFSENRHSWKRDE